MNRIRPTFFLLCFLTTTLIAAEPIQQTASGIALDTPWKTAVYKFSREKLQHPSWGIAHCERNYQLAMSLALHEKLTVDADVLFAAAFLHDIGVFTPYRKDGVDHTERAAQVAEEILKTAGFPMAKFSRVQEAMRSHMFYSEVGHSAEARVFHDADTLDFLGAIGVARILAVTGNHRWAPTLADAAATLEKFQKELPGKLFTQAAKTEAQQRVVEMEQFLKALRARTHGGKAI